MTCDDDLKLRPSIHTSHHSQKLSNKENTFEILWSNLEYIAQSFEVGQCQKHPITPIIIIIILIIYHHQHHPNAATKKAKTPKNINTTFRKVLTTPSFWLIQKNYGLRENSKCGKLKKLYSRILLHKPLF